MFLFSSKNNSANKDGSNHKAEVAAMIEAAKSKIHQVGGTLQTLNVLHLCCTCFSVSLCDRDSL